MSTCASSSPTLSTAPSCSSESTPSATSCSVSANRTSVAPDSPPAVSSCAGRCCELM